MDEQEKLLLREWLRQHGTHHVVAVVVAQCDVLGMQRPGQPESDLWEADGERLWELLRQRAFHAAGEGKE
jgi:hypothetical protein